MVLGKAIAIRNSLSDRQTVQAGTNYTTKVFSCNY